MKGHHLASLFFLMFVFVAYRQIPSGVFEKPVNFPKPIYRIQANNISQEKVALGRALFYETLLSRDNTISCGSCHVQSSAFTQHGHDISHGIDDRLGNRNSPPIMNLAWNRTFFWDGGVFDLDLQALSPITNPVEMDEKMENIIDKLSASHKYSEGFQLAFGSREITGVKVLKALSAFMLTCVSSDAKYDSVMRYQSKFTKMEKSGFRIFRQKCAACHAEPLFTDGSFRNNGLSNKFNPDSGRVAITLDPKDRYKFRVPSLRNLSFTLPFMHDGRFKNIDQVLEHYSHGISDSPTLDPLLRRAEFMGIPLTSKEKHELKSFLKTLDDRYFITRKDLSENFNPKR